MSAAPGFATRLKRAAAFVAIVWSVAASFVVIQVAALRAFDLAVAYQELFGGLLVSPTVSESTTCLAAPGASPDFATSGAPTALAGAWELGLVVGRDAILRQLPSADSSPLGALAASVERSSSALGVTSPGAFVPRQLLNAHREFVAWIEADSGGTARQLASRHSPRACHLYKLGAVWGYSAVVRVALPGAANAYSTEIRHYARQAELPDQLWRPMLEPMPAAAAAAVELAGSALTADVTSFLLDRRP